MTEPFDAVLAEMQNCHFNGASRQTIERWADRLSAAHAAELAERDELRERNGQLAATMLNERARAEAAERKLKGLLP